MASTEFIKRCIDEAEGSDEGSDEGDTLIRRRHETEVVSGDEEIIEVGDAIAVEI